MHEVNKIVYIVMSSEQYYKYIQYLAGDKAAHDVHQNQERGQNSH